MKVIIPSIVFCFSLTLLPLSGHAMKLARSYQSCPKCVCYDRRVFNSAGDPIYIGCYRSHSQCYVDDANHFGCYSSCRAARKALGRCRSGNPRFVD